MTSEQLAELYRQAEDRWPRTALRRRLHAKRWALLQSIRASGEKRVPRTFDLSMWKDRFCARALSLHLRWRRMPQRPPKPNSSPPIWDLVIADMRRSDGPITDAVMNDMRQRDALGRERYGTPLQACNGRDALRDAYEESLDGAAYLKQGCEEGMPLDPQYRRALDQVYELREQMHFRGLAAIELKQEGFGR